jgi:rRNA maturation endonuclease Nob1
MFDPELMRLQIIDNVKKAPEVELKQLFETVLYNVRQNFCPNCGKLFQMPDHFCSQCGGKRELYMQWWH